jgi:superfamily II RNA helicase
MVKICSITHYPEENESKYHEYFEKYPYTLSIFQKYAVEAIVEGNHVLITAHTGSGKTMPAEFAIEYFVSKGKKVIYTGPIKSLINQKFYDFTQKYPHIQFGILTGDIKFNPEADVLIVTAEILLNKLYQMNSLSLTTGASFEMDFQNELACVVMDEVHYINEEERGHVWENTIMMLPPHIQLVMLSATIDKPETFATWCENIHAESPFPKQVYLTNTNHRVVPLTHYSFITVTQTIFKIIKDKAVQEEIKRCINTPFVIQDSSGRFQEDTYFKINKILKLFEHHDVRVKRAHVLNQVTKYLVENEMLPALCFVLSRKQLEICANEVTTNLLEFDSKVPYIIDRECEQIIRKLPNYQEYLNLPEYVNMVKLLQRGIAIHHSGIMPVLKEMVELLYAKGYIKLLFATETFSIGVNMPTKTVIFTDVNKFDGKTNRPLYSHELMQMAGRAGRRGIDTVGNCFHLNNLFRNVDSVNYKKMMNNKPQTLTSKFKISFSLLLSLFSVGEQNIEQYTERSMVTIDLHAQLKEITDKIAKEQSEMVSFQKSQVSLKTPEESIQEYMDLKKKLPTLVNKKRKEAERQLQRLHDMYKTIEADAQSYQKGQIKKDEISELTTEYEETSRYLSVGIENVIHLLQDHGFIQKEVAGNEDTGNEDTGNEDTGNENTKKTRLTLTGEIASHLKEMHCLVFANLLIGDSGFHALSAKQLVSMFSCFTNITVPEELKTIHINDIQDTVLQQIIVKTTEMYHQFQDEELKYNINTGIDYSYHYDLISYTNEWCECQDVTECKLLLQKMEQEKEIFLGEFVKAILKINNMVSELEKVCEIIGNISLLSKLQEIPSLTMKFVITNQSLYV